MSVKGGKTIASQVCTLTNLHPKGVVVDCTALVTIRINN